ncbi:MAG: Hsp20/alpha crystallin family protein [Polaromonas sp.]|uniref:Hsp20/alpha crystallin family protein n=1 Tax=Polaromonas sp. TaxID=1869339 RepID=UPI002486FC64|nr:Hsp20/alpha crystallin family protein [Polaromonas sp.]MDI1238900.1 Hsp20/alpha crystallin family protein [Polaromonas sp.]
MNQNTALNQNDVVRDVAPATQGGADSAQGAGAQRTTAVLPPVDIFEDDAGFTVLADLPGVSRDRMAVRVDGDSLVIEGAAAAPVGADMTLIYGEVLNPLYRRTFTLSRELDPGKIEAKLDNGVLRLHIPKAEEARPRRIEVALA